MQDYREVAGGGGMVLCDNRWPQVAKMAPDGGKAER